MVPPIKSSDAQCQQSSLQTTREPRLGNSGNESQRDDSGSQQRERNTGLHPKPPGQQSQVSAVNHIFHS